MFKWVCYATAVVFAAALLWVLVGLKRDVSLSLDRANAAVETIHDNLPEIVEEVKAGTETLARLSEDVELIKSVAGVRNEESERGFRGLATYADELQRVLAAETEGKGAVILLEKIIGRELEQTDTIEEFLVGLNREMIAVILPLAKSRQEVLYRACTSKPPRRKPYYIRLEGGEPEPLEAFLRRHHAASRELPEYVP